MKPNSWVRLSRWNKKKKKFEVLYDDKPIRKRIDEKEDKTEFDRLYG